MGQEAEGGELALPRRVLHRRRAEHRHQGSQSPVHQPCAHPETRDPTLLKHGVHGEKATENLLGGVYSCMSLKHRSSGSFPRPKMFCSKENETSQCTWDRGYTQRRARITAATAGLGRNPPQGACPSWEACSLVSPFLKPPFKTIPFKI